MNVFLIAWITICLLSFFVMATAFGCEEEVVREIVVVEEPIVYYPDKPSYSLTEDNEYGIMHNRMYSMDYWTHPDNINNPDNYYECLMAGYC